MKSDTKDSALKKKTPSTLRKIAAIAIYGFLGFVLCALFSDKSLNNDDNNQQRPQQTLNYQCSKGAVSFLVMTAKGNVKVEISENRILFGRDLSNKEYVVAYKPDFSTKKSPIHHLTIGDTVLSEKYEPLFFYTTHPNLFAILNSATKTTPFLATIAMGNRKNYADRIPPYKFEYVSFSFPLSDAMAKYKDCTATQRQK
jgi:hypothetical protein